MNVIYISQLIDEETYRELFTKEKKPMHAANKYHTLLCEGLSLNGVNVNTYSVLPVTRENCDKRYVHVHPKKQGRLKLEYIPCWNVPVIRHFQLLIMAFFKTLFAPKGTVVMYDALVIAASLGAVFAAKLRKHMTVAIVTDLPQFQPIASNSHMLNLNKKLFDFADGFVFLTARMNDVVNPQKKPYIVLEGHVDCNMEKVDHLPYDGQKRVLYAGSLKSIYGIQNLCESFLKCCKDEELHIYGDGDYASELVALQKQNANIIYHGNCMNHEVVEAERSAILLVNPRPTTGEYTKFSFPSKTMEYMASGTPVLSAKLPGIPAEYDKFLYYFDDTSSDGLQKMLREILDKEVDELLEKGGKARKFVLEKKNNCHQAELIIRFIKSMEEGIREDKGKSKIS